MKKSEHYFKKVPAERELLFIERKRKLKSIWRSRDMSKISCNVIQDIMPLYVDEIVSEDTKKLVEEHLKECEDCRKEMEKMRAKIILPNKKKINQAEKELFQKLKHRLINRRIAAAILGAILVCALLQEFIQFWCFRKSRSRLIHRKWKWK